jgi:hypothetical protein
MILAGFTIKLYKTNLHPPISNTTKYQKGPYYSGIKIFNHLPENTKKLSNNILPFRSALTVPATET